MLVVFGAKPDHMVKQAPITKRRRLLKLNTRTIAKQCRLHVSKSALLGIFGLNESFSLFLKDLVDAWTFANTSERFPTLYTVEVNQRNSNKRHNNDNDQSSTMRNKISNKAGGMLLLLRHKSVSRKAIRACGRQGRRTASMYYRSSWLLIWLSSEWMNNWKMHLSRKSDNLIL